LLRKLKNDCILFLCNLFQASQELIGGSMISKELQIAMDLVENALASAMNAERWSLSASNDDHTGKIHHAWRSAQETVVVLQQLKTHLQILHGT
jgi:hypothetical protein